MGIIKNIFKTKEKEQKPEVQKPPVVKKNKNDDIIAVIATTIHLYIQEVHDFENYSLTIKRIDKIYSPWSSKIYGLRKWTR
jgi:glutaconyl-CoA/methylmalonyl-CoA decarboxylase subunit delta